MQWPINALVLSVDEKTGIQAKERIHRDQPAQPGQHARREFEYRRHGIAKLVAALDVASGEILADTIDRNDAVTFIAFLETIEAATDPTVEIHVILDYGFLAHCETARYACANFGCESQRLPAASRSAM